MVIRVEKKPPVTIIIIDNPEVKNAIDRHNADALSTAFREFENDKEAYIAVLWGDHGCFCSGADLKALQSDRKNRIQKNGEGPMGPTRMLLSKPTIAAISGYAVGGGLELALWCDIRVVEEDAIFGVFNRRWGIPLIDGGTVRLPRLIGLSRTLDMIITGRAIDAKEALTFGLANRIVPIGKARFEAEKLAQEIAKFPQICLREDRLSTYEQYDLDIREALTNEFHHGLKSLNHAKQGIELFLKGKGRHGEF